MWSGAICWKSWIARLHTIVCRTVGSRGQVTGNVRLLRPCLIQKGQGRGRGSPLISLSHQRLSHQLKNRQNAVLRKNRSLVWNCVASDTKMPTRPGAGLLGLPRRLRSHGLLRALRVASTPRIPPPLPHPPQIEPGTEAQNRVTPGWTSLGQEQRKVPERASRINVTWKESTGGLCPRGTGPTRS